MAPATRFGLVEPGGVLRGVMENQAVTHLMGGEGIILFIETTGLMGIQIILQELHFDRVRVVLGE